MVDYKTFKLENLEFIDELSWFYRLYIGLSIQIAKVLRFVPPSPVMLKGVNRSLVIFPSFNLLGQSIGLSQPETFEILSFHNHRFVLGRTLAYTLINFLILAFVVVIVYLNVYSYTRNFIVGYGILLALGVSGIIIFVVASIIVRVISISLDKYFAESLCIFIVLSLILELSRDDVLIRSDRRKNFLIRINYLAKTTLLLASRYSSDDESNQSWVQRHFKEIASYIRERERWAIAPTKTTLADLRQDFYKLAPIYLDGRYGDFTWQNVATELEETPPVWHQRLIDGIPRFVGIILPLVLMGLYLWKPGLYPGINLDTNIVTLIFIAWLLLSIDISLKLGFVASVTNLAKGIKELS